MSTYGTCSTPLFEMNVQHVISMDDCGSPKNPLHSYISVFVRVYKWELDLTLRRPGKRFYINRYDDGNIPHLFRFSASVGAYPERQYSGDFTERMKDDPYYGQKPA